MRWKEDLSSKGQATKAQLKVHLSSLVEKDNKIEMAREDKHGTRTQRCQGRGFYIPFVVEVRQPYNSLELIANMFKFYDFTNSQL